MASDNTRLSAAVGEGDLIRDLADADGVKWPANVVSYATTIAPGANVLVEVTPSTGLPIAPASGAVFAVTGTFWQATQPISAASLPLPTGAATEATLASLLASIDVGVDVTNFPSGFLAAQSGVWSVGITNATLAVTQSGSWTVGVSGSVAVTGTFWQATQPISAVSLPLPTGAATEATLSTLNGKVTACDTGAVTISGALPAGGNAIGKLASNSGVTIGAVEIAAGQTVGVTGTFWQATQPVSAASLPLPTGASTEATLSALSAKITACNTGAVTLASNPGVTVGAVEIAAGQTVGVTGTFWQATQPVSAASLPLPTGASTETTLSALNTKVTACNTGAVTISSALPAGSNAIGKLAANSGVTIGAVEIAATQTLAAVTTVSTVTSLTQFNGNAIATGAGSTTSGTLRTTIATDQAAVPVTQKPATSGGLSVSRVIDFSGANQGATQVKGSAGQVFGWILTNTNASARYVKIYNAASPTSASTPVLTLMVPGNAAGSGMVAVEFTNGIEFSTAIGIRATTAYADNDTGSVTAGEVIANIMYK